MKRSRSGTASPDKGPGTTTIILIVALAIVLAFAGSFVFGLRRATEVEPPLETLPAEPAAAVRDDRPRVEVLNGAGKSGFARDATDRLRDAGFDVVQFGNADAITSTSQVLDRVGRIEVATEIGKALGITNVKTDVDSTRFVEVTVILGSDWRSRREPKQ